MNKMVFYISCQYPRLSLRSVISFIREIIHLRNIARLIWKYNFCAVCPVLNTFSFYHAVLAPYYADSHFDIMERCDIIVFPGGWQYNPIQAREYYLAILLNKIIIHEKDLLHFLKESKNGTLRQYNYMKKFTYLLNVMENNLIKHS